MLQPRNITEYFINNYVTKGDIAVDATAGNGNDTFKLCKAVGESGKVYAFDIQEIALDNTKKLLNKNMLTNAELIQDSHSNIDKYISENVKCAIFNLGYLPGGDHTLSTCASSSVEAIKKSLELISDDGFVSVTVYYGKNSGTEEKDAVMEFFKALDYKRYTVVTYDFYNRPNNPPITVIITKNPIRL